LAQAALQAAEATPAQIRRQGRTLRQIPARTRVHGEPDGFDARFESDQRLTPRGRAARDVGESPARGE
jgi:hypothetical protein